jgi:hypothetical protein
MAEFTLTGQDGKKYAVTAATEAEAKVMLAEQFAPSQTSARLPAGATETKIALTGGTVYKTPDGGMGYVDPSFSTNDPQEVQRILSGEDPRKIFQQKTSQSITSMNPVRARLANAASYIPFMGEYVDEIAGTYNPQAASDIRLAQQSFKATNPVEAAVEGIGTAIGTTAPLGRVIPAYTTTRAGRGLQRGAEGGMFGGVEGLVSGYGAGNTPEERRQMALERGMFGTLFGAPVAAAGGIAEGMYEGSKRINVTELAKELGISNDAATVISRLALAGSTPQQIDARLTLMGSNARLANSGQASKNLLDIAQTYSPAAQETISTGVRQAGREVRKDFGTFLNETLGTPAGTRQIFREAAAKTAPQRDRAYQLAYSSLIDYSSFRGQKILDALSTVPEDLLQAASKKANDLMQVDELVVPQFKLVTAGGKTTLESAPSVIQLDYLKRALGDIAADTIDPITGKMTSDGNMASKLYRRVAFATKEAVPAYKKAVQLGLENIQEETAIRLMTNFGRTDYEAFTDLFKEINNPQQRAQLKEGMQRMLRSNIQESLNNARATISNPESTEESVSAAVQVFKDYTTTNAGKKLRLVMDKPDAEAFSTQMNRLAEQLTLQSVTSRGSATAFRNQGLEVVKDLQSKGVVDTALSGNLPAAGKEIINNLLGSIGGDPDKLTSVLNEVGTALMLRRGDANARRIAGIIRKIRDGEQVSQREAQEAAQTVLAFTKSSITEPTQQIMQQRE